MNPSYLDLAHSGELLSRRDQARAILAECALCSRACGADRLAGERGYCRSGPEAIVASHNLHHGEEPAISGRRGSGTIFFSNCTLRCLFCQNYPISQLGVGQETGSDRLAGMMLELQRRGAHNVNLVTPTHFVPQIVEALCLAVAGGFHLPLVYNTNGYDSLKTLRLLDGVVDVYLPDAKYSDEDSAKLCSNVDAYVEHNRAALREMHRQVGRLVLDEDGVARRGLIVRHLVLPHDLSGTRRVLRWIVDELSPETAVSLMGQYFPAHKALDHHLLNRHISWEEYQAALDAYEEAGLECGWVQDFSYHD